jgi:hypothetical protein
MKMTINSRNRRFLLRLRRMSRGIFVLGVLSLSLFTSSYAMASGKTTSTSVRPAPPSAVLPSQAAFPAYQHIPYSNINMVISLTNVAPNRKFDLEVFSQTLTVPQLKLAYKRFLRKYHDPGTKYIPHFATVLGCTPQSC